MSLYKKEGVDNHANTRYNKSVETQTVAHGQTTYTLSLGIMPKAVSHLVRTDGLLLFILPLLIHPFDNADCVPNYRNEGSENLQQFLTSFGEM